MILQKRLFHGAPAAILALSIVAGSVVGKWTVPKTGQWLPVTLPVIGLLAIVEPTPVALFGVGIIGGIVLESLKRVIGRNEGVWVGKELTLEGTAGKTNPGRFGGVDLVFKASENLSLQNSSIRMNLIINVPGKDVPLPGTSVRIRARLKDSSPEKAFRRYHRGRAVEGSLLFDSGTASFVHRGSERLNEALGRTAVPASGLLGGISLGQRWRVDRSTKNILRRTGTYHLMAVSGVHLASALLPPLFLVRVLMTLSGMDRFGWRSILPSVGGGASLLIYLSMTGLSTSASRAGIFLLLAWLGFFCRRSREPVSIIGWCVMFIICISSRAQPDLALLLSAGAVLGIFAATGQPSRFAVKALSLTLGAVLFTLPLSVWCAGGVPLVSPICNVTAGLFFSVILIPFAVLIDLAACFSRIPLAPVVRSWNFLANPVLDGLERISTLKVSFLVLSEAGCLVATVAGLAALAIWKKRRFGFWAGLVLFLGVAVVAGAFEHARNTFLSGRTVLCFPRVGQADAAIWRSGGRTIIIDCAASAPPGRTSPVVKALSRMGTREIEAVFLTHAHPDHIGGFREIAMRWKVRTLYLPEIEKDPARWSSTIGSLPDGADVVSLVKGDKIHIGSLFFSVVGPPPEWKKERGENAGSLQLHVHGEGFSALFTGDAQWDQVHRSLDRLERLDLIKIPHHGSKAGFPPSGLGVEVSRLRRKLGMTAVFPSPPPGRPGLPAREVVDWFESRGIRCVFTGGKNGVCFRIGE